MIKNLPKGQTHSCNHKNDNESGICNKCLGLIAEQIITPRTIRVGGFTWEIITDDNVTYQENYGMTHHSDLKIFIDSKQCKQKQEETLLHEVLHACMWQCGLNEKFRSKEVLTEEDIVLPLSMILYQVLKDNKLL